MDYDDHYYLHRFYHYRNSASKTYRNVEPLSLSSALAIWSSMYIKLKKLPLLLWKAFNAKKKTKGEPLSCYSKAVYGMFWIPSLLLKLKHGKCDQPLINCKLFTLMLEQALMSCLQSTSTNKHERFFLIGYSSFRFLLRTRIAWPYCIHVFGIDSSLTAWQIPAEFCRKLWN